MKNSARRLVIVLLFICTFTVWVNGQRKTITGIIADSASGEPVEYAQILNFSLQKLTYSNRIGAFTLEVGIGDTLVFYGLGYLYQKVVVTPVMIANGRLSVLLEIQPYELAAANIRGIGSYEVFKERLINKDIPLTKTEKLKESLAGPVLTAAMEGFAEYMNAHPAIARIPILTPEEKERLKLDKIKGREQIRDQVYRKFNPPLVKEITGLTEDNDIIEFMVWCRFTDAYIIEANEYDLAERIAAKFELFKKMKAEENINNEPLNSIEQFLWQFA